MVSKDLGRLIAQWEGDSFLLEPERLRARLEALDELDVCFGETGREEARPAQMAESARAIRSRLDAVNSAIYEGIRSEVRKGAGPKSLRHWIEVCGKREQAPACGQRASGLNYDCLDELVSGVLQLREPGGAAVHPGTEEVFYQPTPVRHILQMAEVSGLSEADVLVDIGSGLGHVPILASILTGARALGIETEAAYVASARECAERLGLSRVTFVEQDARDEDFSTGTVFYLYTPFTGGLLRTVVGSLRRESAKRALRVCTLGPCTAIVAKEPWLRGNGESDLDGIACFWPVEGFAFPPIPR